MEASRTVQSVRTEVCVCAFDHGFVNMASWGPAHVYEDIFLAALYISPQLYNSMLGSVSVLIKKWQPTPATVTKVGVLPLGVQNECSALLWVRKSLYLPVELPAKLNITIHLFGGMQTHSHLIWQNKYLGYVLAPLVTSQRATFLETHTQ